ncbi:MAG: hypothetical protein KAU14_05220, partial [Thermoplasmata archaeon]|nr:hypothetical protein [Thermoplasmata archaeon]
VHIEDLNGTILWKLDNYEVNDLMSVHRIIYWKDLDPEPPSNCSYPLIPKCWFSVEWRYHDKFYTESDFVRP